MSSHGQVSPKEKPSQVPAQLQSRGMQSGPTPFELLLSVVFALKNRTERNKVASLLFRSERTLVPSLCYRRPREALVPEVSTIQVPFQLWGLHPGLCREHSPLLFPVCFAAFLCLCLTLLSKIQDQGSTTTFSHLFLSDHEQGWFKERLSALAVLTRPALVRWQGPVLGAQGLLAPVSHT